VAGWQWGVCVFGVMGIILSGDKLKIGAILTEIWLFFWFLVVGFSCLKTCTATATRHCRSATQFI
jgi:hypothetical protein